MLTSSPVARRGLCTWPLAPSHVPSCSGCLSTLWTDVFQVHLLSSPPTACHWHPETHTAVLGSPLLLGGHCTRSFERTGGESCVSAGDSPGSNRVRSHQRHGASPRRPSRSCLPSGENRRPATACPCRSSEPSAQLLCPLCLRCPGRQSPRACGLPVSPAEGVPRAPASNITSCSFPSVWLRAYCLILDSRFFPKFVLVL